MAHRLRNKQNMKRRNRPRDKKKFDDDGRSPPKAARTSVKIKPKEEEPCRTRNRHPKVQLPGA